MENKIPFKFLVKLLQGVSLLKMYAHPDSCLPKYKKCYDISGTEKTNKTKLSFLWLYNNVGKYNIYSKKETFTQFCMNLAGILMFYENM